MAAAVMRRDAIAVPGRAHARRLRSLSLGILALILATSGCGDDGTERPCPSIPAGRIEGVIRSGGVPFTAQVGAEMLDAPSGSSIRVSTVAASDGSFALDLPAGGYCLWVEFEDGDGFYYSAKGPVTRFSDADTLEIRSGQPPHHVEFILGGLQVRISGYAIPAGAVSLLEPHRSGSNRYAQVRGTLESGVLSFDVAGLLPGVYRLMLKLPTDAGTDGLEEFWLPGTRLEALADSVQVEPGQAALYQRSVWGSLSHVKGEVLGSWQALRGYGGYPRVYLLDADSSRVAVTDVDQSGSFDVALRVPEPVKILVDIGDVEAWVGGDSFAEATLFDLRPGETIEIRYVEGGLLVDIEQLVSDQTVPARIRLVDGTTGRLISDSDVYIDRGEWIVAFPNLHAGSYLLRLTPDALLAGDWIAQWYDRASSIDLATAIPIQGDGDIVPVTMNLERGGRILGSIETAREDPPSLYRVFVTGADSTAVLGVTELDPGSTTPPYTFTAIGLPDGDYKVGVKLRAHDGAPADTVWYPATRDWSSAGTVSIHDHLDVEGITVTVP